MSAQACPLGFYRSEGGGLSAARSIEQQHRGILELQPPPRAADGLLRNRLQPHPFTEQHSLLVTVAKAGQPPLDSHVASLGADWFDGDAIDLITEPSRSPPKISTTRRNQDVLQARAKPSPFAKQLARSCKGATSITGADIPVKRMPGWAAMLPKLASTSSTVQFPPRPPMRLECKFGSPPTKKKVAPSQWPPKEPSPSCILPTEALQQPSEPSQQLVAAAGAIAGTVGMVNPLEQLHPPKELPKQPHLPKEIAPQLLISPPARTGGLPVNNAPRLPLMRPVPSAAPDTPQPPPPPPPPPPPGKPDAKSRPIGPSPPSHPPPARLLQRSRSRSNPRVRLLARSQVRRSRTPPWRQPHAAAAGPSGRHPHHGTCLYWALRGSSSESVEADDDDESEHDDEADTEHRYSAEADDDDESLGKRTGQSEHYDY